MSLGPDGAGSSIAATCGVPQDNAAQASHARIPDHALCRGPGNVTHALGITLKDNRLDLLGDKLFIDERGHRAGELHWSPRIGISVGTERHWRCFIEGHQSVSGSPSPSAGNS